jgi:DNA-binding MarR family transcriptional regulator
MTAADGRAMPPGLADSPGLLLWHVSLGWQREVAAALAPLNLTPAQFVLLATAWWLNSRGEHPSQLRLAREARTDVKMTSQVLNALEAKGLIRRDGDAADARVKRLVVTGRGAELAVRAIAAAVAADTSFFRPLPDAGALLAMLRPLAGPPR